MLNWLVKYVTIIDLAITWLLKFIYKLKSHTIHAFQGCSSSNNFVFNVFTVFTMSEVFV